VRFERLVSEAATAALDYLDMGYEVALVTREDHLPFATGLRQRRRILEILALVEPVEENPAPLQAPGVNERSLELSMAAIHAEPITATGVGTAGAAP
jgi:uncharacterized protein (DUF58 family)